MEEEQKKLKNINGTLILFHENVYLLSSPKQTRRYVNDAAFFVSAKKKHKNYGPRCKSSRQFFFFFLYCPTSFCIGLLYTYIFETCKH